MKGRAPRALWIATAARGGIAGYVAALQGTELCSRWQIEQLPSHDDGPLARRLALFARACAGLAWRCLVRRPAVVHLHSAAYGSFARKALLLWAAKGVFRVPTVLHLHCGEFEDFYARCPRFARALVRASLARADRVVALSPSLARAVRDIAPRARVLVVPNGVRVPGELPDRPDRPPTALFLGLLIERKDPLGLVRAWARAQRPLGARLLIAGDGPLRSALQELVARLRLEGSVELLGWVAPERAAELLAGADLLALPSTFEGQPLALIEGMARGAAIVSTHAGGIPDLIEDGVSGLLVPPHDEAALSLALSALLGDPALRRRLGSAAYARARRDFNLERTWRRLDALYQELASERKRLDAAEVV